ncbi:MAG: hypothetical protein IPK83_06210 [Planctomycetes bacterium]|nr:hypothetical protein [Planctomycetota bacterium]
MLKRYEFLGLIALALAGSASFALAGNEGTTLDAIVKHIDAALTGSPLSQEELSSILDKAIATQQQFDSLSAVFRASYYENIERMSPESLKLFPNLVYNNGNMTGTLYWWRDGALERLDSKFDIPKKFMQQQYEDHIAFKDSEKQISYLCRTHQGAILGPGSLHAQSRRLAISGIEERNSGV